MRKIIATLTQTTKLSVDNGEWMKESESFLVEVMAIAQGYAMVRRKGCSPFIVHFTSLKDIK